MEGAVKSGSTSELSNAGWNPAFKGAERWKWQSLALELRGSVRIKVELKDLMLGVYLSAT